jgi:hypothetical protein
MAKEFFGINYCSAVSGVVASSRKLFTSPFETRPKKSWSASPAGKTIELKPSKVPCLWLNMLIGRSPHSVLVCSSDLINLDMVKKLLSKLFLDPVGP